jgi:hypothetical protein
MLITAARYINETAPHRYRSIGQSENKPHRLCELKSVDYVKFARINIRFSIISLSEQRGSTFYARLLPLEKVAIGFGQGREGFNNSFRMICNNSDNGSLRRVCIPETQ